LAVSPTPGPPKHLVALALAGLVGFTGNGNAAHSRTGAGQQLDSRALVVDGNHARVDALTSLAVVASARAIAVGFTVAWRRRGSR
jgi:divalent metal cation (Fe/Co/Zn/Cd) transporter